MYRRLLRYALVTIFGVGGFPAGAEPLTQDVSVRMRSYAIDVSPVDIASGRVRFHISNDAPDLLHEFLLVRTELQADELPVEEEGHVDEDSPSLELIVSAEDIEPGETRHVLVTLNPGQYVYFCNMGGHHMLGMRGQFVVRGPRDDS